MAKTAKVWIDVADATESVSGWMSSSDKAKLNGMQSGSRYSADLSWSGTGPYTATVSGATHGRGTYPVIQVLKLNSGNVYDIVYVDMQIDVSNGNISISSTSNFTGKVIVI